VHYLCHLTVSKLESVYHKVWRQIEGVEFENIGPEDQSLLFLNPLSMDY
jgi:hypothetical protein